MAYGVGSEVEGALLVAEEVDGGGDEAELASGLFYFWRPVIDLTNDGHRFYVWIETYLHKFNISLKTLS